MRRVLQVASEEELACLADTIVHTTKFMVTSKRNIYKINYIYYRDGKAVMKQASKYNYE